MIIKKKKNPSYLSLKPNIRKQRLQKLSLLFLTKGNTILKSLNSLELICLVFCSCFREKSGATKKKVTKRFCIFGSIWTKINLGELAKILM
jgi:hypothetical protein